MMQSMKGIFAILRRLRACELRARWVVNEREALDLLSVVVPRRLESAVHIPRRNDCG